MGTRKGFTLAEALIVMALVVVFASAAVPAVGNALEDARNKQREIELAAAANDAYTQVLEESRKPENRAKDEFYVEQPPEVLKALQDFKNSADDSDKITFSFGDVDISVTAAQVPDNVTQLDYVFQKEADVWTMYAVQICDSASVQYYDKTGNSTGALEEELSGGDGPDLDDLDDL